MQKIFQLNNYVYMKFLQRVEDFLQTNSTTHSKDLIREQTAPPSPMSGLPEKDYGTNYSFLEDNYDKLKLLWDKHYRGFSFLTKDEMKSYTLIASEDSKRYTASPNKFRKLKDNFPLIDLIARLEAIRKNTTKKTISSLKTSQAAALSEFINRVNSSPNIPLDYHPPMEAWTDMIKHAYFADVKDELAKMRFDTLDSNMSFYSAVYHLLFLRRRFLDKKLPDDMKTFKGEPYVNDIILNIKNVISGKLPIRDQKIAQVYDEEVSNLLLKVAMAAYTLYKQQVESKLRKSSSTEEEVSIKINNLLNSATKFQEFMGYNKPNSTPMLLGEQMFEIACNNVLNKFITEVEYTATPQQPNTEVWKPGAPNISLFQNERGEYVFNLKNLKKAAEEKLEPAKLLIQSMTSLADHVKRKSEIDYGKLAGAIAGVASALGPKAMPGV
jgi:hypothetical protein